jgi:hypothetical protein
MLVVDVVGPQPSAHIVRVVTAAVYSSHVYTACRLLSVTIRRIRSSVAPGRAVASFKLCRQSKDSNMTDILTNQNNRFPHEFDAQFPNLNNY